MLAERTPGRDASLRYARKNRVELQRARRGLRREQADRLNALKLASGCVRCGYREHAAALEFHHTDPSTKSTTVARMKGESWDCVMEEVAKCEVLCANCHRVEHTS